MQSTCSVRVSPTMRRRLKGAAQGHQRRRRRQWRRRHKFGRREGEQGDARDLPPKDGSASGATISKGSGITCQSCAIHHSSRPNCTGMRWRMYWGSTTHAETTGAYGLPTWQISVANGAATVGAPNGSTVGIASEAELRDALTCPYSCWAHANFQPAGTLRALIQRAARKLSRSEPLTCAHMRTMWVDDQRCVPNPRGCHQIEFRRLVYWNTSGSMQHGSGGDTYASSSGARGAIDGNPDHFSTTMGHRSPLWWRVEVTRPLPICRVVLRVLDEGSTESERQMSGAQSGGNGHHGPKRLRVSV